MAHLGVAVGPWWTREAVVLVVLLDVWIIRADRTRDRILALRTVGVMARVGGWRGTFGRGGVTLIVDTFKSSELRLLYVSRWHGKRANKRKKYKIYLPCSVTKFIT